MEYSTYKFLCKIGLERFIPQSTKLKIPKEELVKRYRKQAVFPRAFVELVWGDNYGKDFDKYKKGEKMMKYIIVSNQRIADYWKRQGKLYLEDKVITRKEQIRGLSRDPSDYILVYGKEFDYPPINDSFIEMIEELDNMFIGYELTYTNEKAYWKKLRQC